MLDVDFVFLHQTTRCTENGCNRQISTLLTKPITLK